MNRSVDVGFWRGKRVLVTGHTGFKGSWLSLWLHGMGAHVFGLSLAPCTLSMFEQASVEDAVSHELGDVRDPLAVARALQTAQPDVVFHLAAQSLVRPSYDDPLETFSTNVMGTATLLDALRRIQQRGDVSPLAVVVVTTDKCYQNNEWVWGYRESDPLGGHDPYSSSKACAELVTASFRSSFPSTLGPITASVRAGNVIGGGDWAKDRLIPDAVMAFGRGAPLRIRNPTSIRPWQHVLEPLRGYLLLAESIAREGAPFAQAWNFGPSEGSERDVAHVASLLAAHWGPTARWDVEGDQTAHEARLLALDSSQARTLLGWRPKLSLEVAISLTAEWYLAQEAGDSMQAFTRRQIDGYTAL